MIKIVNEQAKELITEILLAHQSLMSLDKGQITQITSYNRGSKSVRQFKRIK